MAVPWTAIYELIWKTALYCLYSTCRSAPQRLSGRAPPPQPYSVKTAGKSELVPGQVVPASTTQEFHVKYKYTVYEQTHKCLVKVFLFMNRYFTRCESQCIDRHAKLM